MSTLPLNVHEVLEQEYVSMYGPLGNVPPPEYRTSDVVDEPWARAILSACGFTETDVFDTLNAFISSNAIPPQTEPAPAKLTAAQLKKLAQSPAITDNGRELIKRYASY